LGTFEARPTLVDWEGKPLPVGEVFVGPEGFTTGITSRGLVCMLMSPDGLLATAAIERGGAAARASCSGLDVVTGDVSRARRTALLLNALLGRLDPDSR
jgi:hypothetical protein